MEGRIALLTFSFTLCMLVLTGCKKGLDDFTFSYTMESVDNYKAVLTVSSDGTYRVEVQNFFVAKQSGKLTPKVLEGKLTGTELDHFSQLLGDTDFFAMKDSYGFEEEASDVSIIYQIYISTGGKDKYISIRNTEANKFPASFIRLLDYVNTFMGEHKVE